MNDPSSVFQKPSDVLDNMELSSEQKIEILRQWKQDIMQRLVAEEENMTGEPGNAERLKQVTDALIALESD